MSEQFRAALKSRVADNEYVSHLKVREYADANAASQAAPSCKTRYIILGMSPSQQRAFVYKARRNANGTYSIGKEWDASHVRSMAREGSNVLVTFSITHRWEIDASQDPIPFLNDLATIVHRAHGALPKISGWSYVPSMLENPPPEMPPVTHPPPPTAASPSVPQRTPRREPQPVPQRTQQPALFEEVSVSATPSVTSAPPRPILQRRLTRPTAAQASTALVAPRDDENSTLSQVEEMLEGFEWKVARHAAPDVRPKRFGTADVIEERLLEELAALESSGIHAMIEPDERVARVLKDIDDALLQLDRLDASVAGYKMQLLSRSEDIGYIQSQNRGLQVQTSNQHLLLQEVEALLSTIQVDQQAMQKLATTTFSAGAQVSDLESAATSLYKSILQSRPDKHKQMAGVDTKAMAEHLAQSEAAAREFNARLVTEFQSELERAMHAQLNDLQHSQLAMASEPTLPPHDVMEQWLGKYCGLALYLRETTPDLFDKFSHMYMAFEAQCYRTELQRVFGAAAKHAGRTRHDDGPSQALQRILASLLARVSAEQTFLADLLQINDDSLTFADYMDLEPYFKHRAAVTMALPTQGPQQALEHAMHQIFAVVVPELDAFVSQAYQQNAWSVVGMLVETELAQRTLTQRAGGAGVADLLHKNSTRLHAELGRLLHGQLQAVEQTKVSVNRRCGILPVFQAFPGFVARMEAQMGEADALPVRTAVDEGYDHVARALMTTIQSIPQTAGAMMDEDKGQLNHHVMVIMNVFHLCTSIKPGTPPNAALVRVQAQAQAQFETSLAGYVKTILRRPLGRVIDFCHGIETLLPTTPATEVALHSHFSRSSAKKLVRDLSQKDVRKAIEALSKRIQKHFDDEDASTALTPTELAHVLQQVWQSSQDMFTAEVERLSRILLTCYPQSGLGLEISTQDVQRLFQTLAPTGRRR